MGQNSSTDDFVHFPIDNIQDDLLRHARILTEIASLSYEDFLRHLGELNNLSKTCLDKNGKRLIFAVKKGTDSSILWKGTVKIGCVKIDPVTSSVETYRMINLAEFLHIFKTLQCHMNCVKANENKRKSSVSQPTTSSINSTEHEEEIDCLTTSLLLKEVDKINICKTFDKNAECCICLERAPEVILPCAHSYCLPCIEQWNVNNKTCPICREKLETTDDTWVISEAPDEDEIAAEISATLDELSKLSPKREMKS